jgi:hypothetical protein
MSGDSPGPHESQDYWHLAQLLQIVRPGYLEWRYRAESELACRTEASALPKHVERINTHTLLFGEGLADSDVCEKGAACRGQIFFLES